jgi:hypothetical protein
VPRRPTFDDRRRTVREDELGADLMQGVRGHTLLAIVTYGSDVEPREHAGIVVRP